jgi:peptidoglycan/xylan/chitin deacetylase (PgdA/CDA1 family)
VIRYAAHRVRRRIDRILHPGGRGAVLLYHRIADEPVDPYGLCTPPARFEEHLQVVREIGRPMALSDLVDALGNGSLPDRAIALTFDDGYLDNLERAEPILAKYDIPALVFVATGPGGREREFWWDELERVFLQPGELPPRLELDMAGEAREWELGAHSVYTREQQNRHVGWHLLDDGAPTARHAVFREMYNLLQPLPTAVRTAVLDRLLVWARDDGAVRPGRRTMTPEQVARLAQGGVMDVGAHTVTHPALPAEPPEVQRMELARSKADLEAWCGRPVRGFAYPYGLYDEVAVTAARDVGFDYACSGDYGPARPGTNPFLIPRIEAPAVDGDTLAGILRWQLR